MIGKKKVRIIECRINGYINTQTDRQTNRRIERYGQAEREMKENHRILL